MKKVTFFNRLTAVLMIFASIGMFLQAKSGVPIDFDIGISIAPRDMGAFFMFLTLLVLPFSLALQMDMNKNTKLIRVAPLASLIILFVFPLRLDGGLWSYGYDWDGTPAMDYYFPDRQVRRSYIEFGYIPFWKPNFSIHPTYETYGPNSSLTREVYSGNGISGKHFKYGLNDRFYMRTVYDGSDIYECVLEETWHFLGYYVRDVRGRQLKYAPETELPKEQCNLIKMPDYLKPENY